MGRYGWWALFITDHLLKHSHYNEDYTKRHALPYEHAPLPVPTRKIHVRYISKQHQVLHLAIVLSV